MKKSYIKITLDLLMAITFALLMEPRVLNGLPFHEIAGLVIGVAVITHILLNYQWVVNVTKKIFNSKLPGKTRFSYLLNILLLLSMVAVIVTGILISRVVFPSLGEQYGRGMRGIHNLTANLTLALVGLHIGVHWQWIMTICKKVFKTKEGKLRNGVATTIALCLILLLGGMQWFATKSTSNNTGQTVTQQQNNTQTFNNGNANPQQFQGKNIGERHEQRGGGSPIPVILQYFLIFAVIIVPTYYIEKRILQNKRKSKRK